MAENNGQTQIKTAGKPQPASVSELINGGKPAAEAGGQNGQGQGQPAAQAGSGATPRVPTGPTKKVETPQNQDRSNQQNQGGTDTQNQQNNQQQEPQMNEEQFQAFLKANGIEGVTSVTELRDKLKPKEEKREPTPEEKKKQEEAIELRMLNTYIAGGGKAEDYVALKKYSQIDVKELSKAELIGQLKEAKFSDQEIDRIIKERYYQLTDEEIESLSDDNDKDFVKRNREFWSKRLENRSAHAKQQAEEILKQLRESVLAEDTLKEKENQFSSTVDETLSKIERKITIQLGEAEGQPIDPIDIEITDEELKDVVATLKDPEKRTQFFYTEGNALNVANIAKVMARNAVLEAAVRKAYNIANDRSVKKLQSVFAGHPSKIGVGGATNTNNTGNKTPGKIASVGKPQVATPVKRTK